MNYSFVHFVKLNSCLGVFGEVNMDITTNSIINFVILQLIVFGFDFCKL